MRNFGEKPQVNKEALRVSAKADFIPANTSAGESDQQAKESIIGTSDQYSKEELVSALGLMMERVNIPETALSELEGDEVAKDRVNILAIQYLEGIKTLDTEKQLMAAKELQRIFG